MNPLYINLNGSFYRADEPVLQANNRAFRYGDSLFESIRLINGHPVHIPLHFARLKKGMDLLGYETSGQFTFRDISNQIEELAQRNGIQKGGRVRLTVFRNDGGYYTPETNEKSYLIEAIPLSDNYYKVNENGYIIDLYTKTTKSLTPFSGLKTGNALEYVLAAQYKKQQNLDECVLVNQHYRLCEAISANLFLFKSNTLYTPALSEGCLAGVMRQKVLELATSLGINCIEDSFTPTNMLQADEIFLTNSVSGIRWVMGYKQKRYFNAIAKKLTDVLNESVCLVEDSNDTF